MAISFKKILSNNAPLKIFSFILGYLLWSILSGGTTVTIEKKVPLCFYNLPDGYQVQAPDYVSVTLAGKRRQVYALNLEELAIHLDAYSVQNNDHPISITKDTLFLPNSIKLVHYNPAPLKAAIIKAT